MSKPIPLGPHLLSAQAVKCLRDCQTRNPSRDAYHPAVLGALVRRNLVKLYSVGSYLDGNTGGQHFVTLTEDGRRLIAAA